MTFTHLFEPYLSQSFEEDYPIQGRHYDTIIMDDIMDKQEWTHPSGSKLTITTYEEPQMSKRKRLKNKPSTKVNEVKVDPSVVEDLRVQTPMSPTTEPVNKFDVEPTNFHAKYTVGRGAAKLIEAAEEYETLARLLRNTANTLNSVHQ